MNCSAAALPSLNRLSEAAEPAPTPHEASHGVQNPRPTSHEKFEAQGLEYCPQNSWPTTPHF